MHDIAKERAKQERAKWHPDYESCYRSTPKVSLWVRVLCPKCGKINVNKDMVAVVPLEAIWDAWFECDCGHVQLVQVSPIEIEAGTENTQGSTHE